MQAYEVITQRFLDLLNQGTIPWRKPWRTHHGASNYVSGKPYRGVNALLLNCSGYSSRYWLTFKQCRGAGGHVKASEKGTPIVFWTIVHENEEDAFPLLRYYTVFNVEQCEGLKPRTDEPVPLVPVLETAQKIVDGMPLLPRLLKGNRAMYFPQGDDVMMPPREDFVGPEEYYCTLFHELVHSTGHASRLNRFAKGYSVDRNSPDYAKEELVAEMGAAFLCSEAGILEMTFRNSAAYVINWAEALSNDPRMVISSAGKAQKAADFIGGKVPLTSPAEVLQGA